MKGNLISCLLVGALLTVPCNVHEPKELRHQVGLWSAHATNLSYSEGTADKPGTRELRIPSPDKKLVLVVRDTAISVDVEGVRLTGTEDEGIHPLAEAAWSPDSAAFFITQSDGGIVGKWFVDIYLIERTKVKRVDVIREVEQDFAKQYRCTVRGNSGATEEPNIGAVAWLEGSTKLLLVAEVPPHSSCPLMGKLGGYVLAVPSGRILQRLDEGDLRANWIRSLGERLRAK